MFIECKYGSQDEILGQIRAVQEVAYAYKLDKSYDIVVKVESDSFEKFTSAMSKIRGIRDMLNTDTMIGFKRS